MTDWAAEPIRPENPGIRQLQAVVRQLRDKLPGDLERNTPIVLVPGFSAWGQPLLGTVNYFGGFSDLALALQNEGYTVIQVRLSPLSSNRERVCEVFQQLANINAAGTGSGFDLPGARPPTLIGVNYGNLPLHPTSALLRPAPQTWQAVVYGALPPSWRWSVDNKVTFICHSQGGTTIRCLLHHLSGNPDGLPLFPESDQRARAKAVITLGTPHKGTTVTNVVQSVLEGDPNLDAVIDFVTSCSFAARRDRVYDLGLDHWGFTRNGNETYQTMRQRIGPAVVDWFNGTVNGLHDNSRPGADAFNALPVLPQTPVYFFTMAFRATIPFPDRNLTRQDISGFLNLFPLGNIASFLGFPIAATTGQAVFRWLGLAPPLQAVVAWMTNVANRHLGAMGYFSQIPQPGSQIPRPDMLPVIAPFAYGMAGQSVGEWVENDGIVNTVSMDGPPGRVRGAAEFAQAYPGQAQGPFWHFGRNDTIDHADQLGVFTDPITNAEVKVMYMLLAELADRI